MRRPPTLRTRLAVLVLALVGCDTPSAPDDAGAPGVRAPAPPSAPSPVRFTCASGYREVALEGGVIACDPWAAERPRCAPGELLRPGGCAPLATDCGVRAPPEASEPGAVFVRPGSAGGDGSLERPFGTIAEAAASGARTIALSPGEHVLPSSTRDVTLAGTCATRTTLRSDELGWIRGTTTLRRVRVTGSGQLTVAPGAKLMLEAAELDGLPRAVEVQGSLVARRTAFRDLPGAAIAAFDPTAIVLEDVSFERIGSHPLWLGEVSEPRAEISLAGVVIAEARRDAILLDRIATLTAERVVVEDTAGHGLLARATSATLRDLVVRRITGAALLLDGGRSELAQLWASDAAAGVTLAGGEHHARALAIAGTEEIALFALDARGSADEVDVRRAGVTGVNVAGGAFAIRDLVVAGVDGADDASGGALLVENGARVTLERAVLEGSEHFGLAAIGAELDASDVEVRAVRARTGDDGYGAVALDGAQLRLARAFIHDVWKTGFAIQDASASAEDLRVERVSAPDGVDGVGVGVLGESSVTIDVARVAETVRWGVLVSGPRASLVASELEVERTRAAPCAATDCRGAQGGAAIVGHDGASAHVSRFRARTSELAGVIAAAGVDLTLERGRIEENAIGLIVSPAVPVNPTSGRGLALREVDLHGNTVDHQATELDVRPPVIAF